MKNFYFDDRLNEGIELVTADDFDKIIDLIGAAQVVLLGEATHGTREFYTYRSEISKKHNVLKLKKGD